MSKPETKSLQQNISFLRPPTRYEIHNRIRGKMFTCPKVGMETQSSKENSLQKSTTSLISSNDTPDELPFQPRFPAAGWKLHVDDNDILNNNTSPKYMGQEKQDISWHKSVSRVHKARISKGFELKTKNDILLDIMNTVETDISHSRINSPQVSPSNHNVNALKSKSKSTTPSSKEWKASPNAIQSSSNYSYPFIDEIELNYPYDDVIKQLQVLAEINAKTFKGRIVSTSSASDTNRLHDGNSKNNHIIYDRNHENNYTSIGSRPTTAQSRNHLLTTSSTPLIRTTSSVNIIQLDSTFPETTTTTTNTTTADPTTTTTTKPTHPVSSSSSSMKRSISSSNYPYGKYDHNKLIDIMSMNVFDNTQKISHNNTTATTNKNINTGDVDGDEVGGHNLNTNSTDGHLLFDDTVAMENMTNSTKKFLHSSSNNLNNPPIKRGIVSPSQKTPLPILKPVPYQKYNKRGFRARSSVPIGAKIYYSSMVQKRPHTYTTSIDHSANNINITNNGNTEGDNDYNDELNDSADLHLSLESLHIHDAKKSHKLSHHHHSHHTHHHDTYHPQNTDNSNNPPYDDFQIDPEDQLNFTWPLPVNAMESHQNAKSGTYKTFNKNTGNTSSSNQAWHQHNETLTDKLKYMSLQQGMLPSKPSTHNLASPIHYTEYHRYTAPAPNSLKKSPNTSHNHKLHGVDKLNLIIKSRTTGTPKSMKKSATTSNLSPKIGNPVLNALPRHPTHIPVLTATTNNSDNSNDINNSHMESPHHILSSPRLSSTESMTTTPIHSLTSSPRSYSTPILPKAPSSTSFSFSSSSSNLSSVNDGKSQDHNHPLERVLSNDTTTNTIKKSTSNDSNTSSDKRSSSGKGGNMIAIRPSLHERALHHLTRSSNRENNYTNNNTTTGTTTTAPDDVSDIGANIINNDHYDDKSNNNDDNNTNNNVSSSSNIDILYDDSKSDISPELIASQHLGDTSTTYEHTDIESTLKNIESEVSPLYKL